MFSLPGSVAALRPVPSCHNQTLHLLCRTRVFLRVTRPSRFVCVCEQVCTRRCIVVVCLFPLLPPVARSQRHGEHVPGERRKALRRLVSTWALSLPAAACRLKGVCLIVGHDQLTNVPIHKGDCCSPLQRKQRKRQHNRESRGGEGGGEVATYGLATAHLVAAATLVAHLLPPLPWYHHQRRARPEREQRGAW